MKKPLEGLLVLEFSQFLAGPSAGLKLADLGARVIKIERPVTGEGGRQIAIKNMFIDGDSLVFHTINRNKESYAANLKDAGDLARVKKLIEKADVMTHNFRPGVMEKIGLDYAEVKKINPLIVYGVVTGYGNEGPWANKPGQDLLIQSLSGLTQLSGTSADGPVPFGLAVADIFCGSHFTQGILAGLIKRGKTKQSVLIEVSLLESTLDMQFELLTTYFNDGRRLPQRASVDGTGHAYLSAPYGIYKTRSGYLAIAMGNLIPLMNALGCDIDATYYNAEASFTKRDEIMKIISDALINKTVEECLSLLEPLGIWCSPVFNYQQLTAHPAYKVLGMEQMVRFADGNEIKTTRCPTVINRRRLYSSTPAPKPGAQTNKINKEFALV